MKHWQAGDALTARSEWTQAFTLDPELSLPADAPAEARTAHDEAVAALTARLTDAAAKTAAAFTVPLPAPEPAGVDTLSPASTPAAGEKAPEKVRPLAAGGRLTLGGYGFYVIGEGRAGPAPEFGFGANVGPVRIGGVAALLFGSSLAFTLAARISTTSPNRLAYLAAFDLGIFYGGASAIFAPFLTAHPLGMRINAGAVGFELHALSLAIFWVGNGFRFVPQAGLALLL
jgi:hypothetical protein